MNKVYLIGNLTRDPEVSETSGGVPYVSSTNIFTSHPLDIT